MNIALFYDTETTGLPDFKAPSESAHQPHIVQLAAQLVNLDTREVIEELNVLTKPDGWVSDQKALEAHGITHERGMAEGIDEAVALERFLAMWKRAELRIAHNEPFDARLVRIAIKRFIDPLNPGREVPVSDEWKAGHAECTCAQSTPIVKMPPTEKMKRAGFNKFKSASLSESFEFFTGKKLEGAHDALVDVNGCKTVYFAIRDGVRERVVIEQAAEQAAA